MGGKSVRSLPIRGSSEEGKTRLPGGTREGAGTLPSTTERQNQTARRVEERGLLQGLSVPPPICTIFTKKLLMSLVAQLGHVVTSYVPPKWTRSGT